MLGSYHDALYGEVSFMTTETFDLDPHKLHCDASVISHHLETSHLLFFKGQDIPRFSYQCEIL